MSKDISITEQDTNQLHPELTSVCGLNPFLQHDSSGRVYMTASHLGQMLVIDGATERNCQTGMEREYGKYTFNIKMPCDGEIIELIDRYSSTLGNNSINHNPQTIVIYEDVETKQLGMISLTKYCSNHQYFGFQYVGKNGLQQLRVGSRIAKDTVFLESPNVGEDGSYKYGIELNMALMTHPATSEDGILICEDVLPRLAFKTYENRVVEWGSNRFALNLYGDEKNYKPFPDIGEIIRDDGVLMALRDYKPELLAPIEQSVKATMKVDFTFDNTVYANGPGGRIVDIKIHHDLAKANCADVHMDNQAQKYDNARRIFYGKIVGLWRKFHAIRGDALLLTPELQRMITEALSVTTENGAQKIQKLYRKAPLDEYRVEFVIEYCIVPTLGFKLTGLHGDKGILCQLGTRASMPVDSEGNSADIVMDPNSTISRMNLGRIYEMYINSASRDTHKLVCKMLNVQPFQSETKAYNYIAKLDPSIVENTFNTLLGYYKIVSPVMRSWFTNGQVDQTPIEYLSEIVKRGVTLFLPTDNQPESTDIVRTIQKTVYKPVYGPVTYIGNSGNKVTTKEPVRIASMYFIVLEKIGDDWSAVSSCKLSHFGVLSQLTKGDKFSKPSRNQAVRGAGEAELRIFSSYVGEDFTAELMDRNNSPSTHKEMVKQIMLADRPGDIKNLVDRSKFPFGNSKPLGLQRHLAAVGGWSFKYKQYKPDWKAP